MDKDLKTALIALAIASALFLVTASVNNVAALFPKDEPRSEAEIAAEEYDDLVFAFGRNPSELKQIGDYYVHPVKSEKETCEEFAICEDMMGEETCENIFKDRREGKDRSGSSFKMIEVEE